MDRQRLNKLVNLVQGQLEPKGYDCVDVEWVASQRILRVFIEKVLAEGDLDSDQDEATEDSHLPPTEQTLHTLHTIDMNDCVIATKALNETDLLDKEIEGAYTLEVSSPGLERPLRTSEHFTKFVGSQVEVKLLASHGERKHGVGEVLSVGDDSTITLETSRGHWSFPLSLVAKANLVYDWNKA